MKDYRVEVKVKNNLLYKAMVEAGYKTAADLARAACVSNCAVCDCLNLKTSMYSTLDGGERIRPIWIKLSVVLKRLPEDLVPKSNHYAAVRRNTSSFDASMEEVAQLAAPSDPHLMLEHKLLSEAVSEAMSSLPSRQRDILSRHFGLDGNEPETLAQIAESQGVTVERIRQIELKARRRMEHPARSKKLKQLGGYG